MAANAFDSRIRGNLRPLRVRSFRGIFLGAACSGVTDGIVPVAFAVYSVQAFGSATSLTVILIALWAGRFACTPVAGVTAARRDQFAVMMWSDLVRIAAQGGLAVVLVATGRDSLAAMAVSAGIYGAATAFYAPALTTVLPRVVPGRDLRTANGLVAMVADISVLVGPALAVALSTTVGFVWILVFDSLTFGSNVLALAYARRAAGPVVRATVRDRRSTFRESRDSWCATVARSPWLGWSVGLWFAVSFAIGLVAVAGPALTVTGTGGGGRWAVLAAGMALAALAGSLSVVAGVGRFGWPFAATALAAAVVLEMVTIAGYSLSAPGPVLLFIGCATAGFAVSVAGIVWQTSLQAELPADELGVFSSAEGFLTAAGVPCGMVAGGAAVAAAGIEYVAVGAAATMLALAVAVRMSMRTSGSARRAARRGRVRAS
ncbi:MFS transporter [Nocardia sp. NBC_01329]|uniref:MFS transporter n=1 Tax=Nocardia sp. NBC_01329 TaxID=2903594 RepID=UPI002E153D0C|nr:MFS transporter [Nocardia sp. NBC_01329]